MLYIPASKPFPLVAKVKQGTIDKVYFQLLDDAQVEVAKSNDIAVVGGSATWSWTPNPAGGPMTLRDDEDLRVVHCVVHKFGANSAGVNDLAELTVFRDRIELKPMHEGKVVKARTRLVVHVPGSLSRKQSFSWMQAEGEAALVFSGFKRWTSIEPQVKAPWAYKDPSAPYVAGKDKGLARELDLIPITYAAEWKGVRAQASAAFEALADGPRMQFVNFEAPPAGARETASHFGHKLELKVGPRGDEKHAGSMIYVKLKPGEKNSKRNVPKPRLIGQGTFKDLGSGVLELRLGDDGATVEAELGYAGGDEFTISVCSRNDFDSADAISFSVVNWRKAFYEIMCPDKMKPALDVSGANWDLKQNVRERVAKILDPIFFKYELAKTQIAPDANFDACQFVPAAHFGRADGRDLFVGSFLTSTMRGASFTSPADPRTINVKLFDVYCDSKSFDIPQTLDLEQAVTPLAPSTTAHFFLPNPKAADPYASSASFVVAKPATWEAVIADPERYKNPDGQLPKYRHPGQDPVTGRPRKERFDPAWMALVDQKKIEVTLPSVAATDPGKLAAKVESATQCPIRLAPFKLVEVQASGGGNLRGEQVCYLHPRVDILAHLIAHELGHAIGMAIFPGEEVPPGLDAPKHVDDGGTYYKHAKVTADKLGKNGIRQPGQGEHCAAKLTDKAATDYPTDVPVDGCVMFGYGPSGRSVARPEPFLFCDTCNGYFRALEATNIRD